MQLDAQGAHRQRESLSGKWRVTNGRNGNRGKLSTSSLEDSDSGGRAGVRDHLLTNLRNYVFPLMQGDFIYALKCGNINQAG